MTEVEKQKNDELIGLLIWNLYTPCRRFWKSVPQGECEFSNTPAFCVIFRLDLMQRE